MSVKRVDHRRHIKKSERYHYKELKYVESEDTPVDPAWLGRDTKKCVDGKRVHYPNLDRYDETN